ncbi:MAG: DUF362 domain-containing protein [Candidatus Bathyarchaeia archaeon]
MKRTIVSLVHRDRVPGTPENYTKEDLKVVKEMIAEALDLIGGINKFVDAGDRVLLKPNILGPLPPERGVTTDPRVMEALIEYVYEQTKAREVIVGENSAVPTIFGSTRKAFEVSRIAEVCKRTGATMAYFDEEIQVQVAVQNAKVFPRFHIPKRLLDCDVYITVPKLKTHIFTVISCCLKNQLGLLPWADKQLAHRNEISYKLVDIYRVIRPNLAVVDGLWAMQGQGPFSPFREDIIQDMNLILAGTDCVAVDAVAAATMGFDPLEIDTIRVAQSEGLGVADLSQIEVRGAKIEDVKRNFKKPTNELIAVFRNVDVYEGASCIACRSFLRVALDSLKADGTLEKIQEKVVFIVGARTTIPENLKDMKTPIFVCGQCAEEYKNLTHNTIYIPGCPPWGLHFISDIIRKLAVTSY